jgi:general secretion pathway protein G
MSEAFSNGKGGCQTSETRCHWWRENRFLMLMLLLGLGLATGVVLRLSGNLRSHRRGSGVSPVRANLFLLHTAVNEFNMDNSRWPTEAEGLTALVRRPADAVNWRPGGYLDTPEVPKDPWGRDFIYELRPSSGRPFVIKSLGADGMPGGDGDDADLFAPPVDDSPVLHDPPIEATENTHP